MTVGPRAAAGGSDGVRHERYPRYRESGVEWLDEVPEHWEVKRISAAARPNADSFTDGDWVEFPYITDRGVRLVQTGNIGIGMYREQGFRYIDESSFDELHCTEVDPGDVLICRLADPVGRACLAPDLGVRMITSVDVCILKSSEQFSASYLVFLFSSKRYLEYVESLVRGGTRDRISRSMLGAIRIPTPPVLEQRTIAAFLDRETERIDALVTKKRLLIERLQEYRTALITRTVTRGLPLQAARAAGLDPAPRLKPSGVEWLGEVPEHWEVRKLSRLLSAPTSYGVLKPESYDDEDGVRLVRILDIGSGLQDGNLMRISPAQSAEYERTIVEEGDLVLSVVGTIGECFEVPPELAGSNLSRALARLQLGSELMPAFLRSFVNSRSFQDWTDGIVRGTAQMVLNLGQLDELKVPAPPIREQRAICTYLEAETTTLDALVHRVSEAIERLQEYRTALITAAVTGKIDVRESAREQPVAN